jgi:hypothetical protein
MRRECFARGAAAFTLCFCSLRLPEFDGTRELSFSALTAKTKPHLSVGALCVMPYQFASE